MPTTTGTSRETTSEETSGEITESTMASVLTSTTQIHHTSTEHSTVGPTSPTETSSSHPNPTSTESTTSLSTSITTISTISTTNSTSSTTISTTVAETTTSSPSTPVVPSTDESAQITSTPVSFLLFKLLYFRMKFFAAFFWYKISKITDIWAFKAIEYFFRNKRVATVVGITCTFPQIFVT